MNAMLFERSAISKQAEETIRHELQALRQEHPPSPTLLLKGPYLLDFLGLNDRYLECDLEDAILREIEQFLLELGAGFTFVARQKRVQIDNDDFHISFSGAGNRGCRVSAAGCAYVCDIAHLSGPIHFSIAVIPKLWRTPTYSATQRP